jgi:hypothetical protein
VAISPIRKVTIPSNTVRHPSAEVTLHRHAGGAGPTSPSTHQVTRSALRSVTRGKDPAGPVRRDGTCTLHLNVQGGLRSTSARTPCTRGTSTKGTVRTQKKGVSLSYMQDGKDRVKLLGVPNITPTERTQRGETTLRPTSHFSLGRKLSAMLFLSLGRDPGQQQWEHQLRRRTSCNFVSRAARPQTACAGGPVRPQRSGEGHRPRE